MSDCRFGVSPVNYPDPDPDPDHCNLFFLLPNKQVNAYAGEICSSLQKV